MTERKARSAAEVDCRMGQWAYLIDSGKTSLVKIQSKPSSGFIGIKVQRDGDDRYISCTLTQVYPIPWNLDRGSPFIFSWGDEQLRGDVVRLTCTPCGERVSTNGILKVYVEVHEHSYIYTVPIYPTNVVNGRREPLVARLREPTDPSPFPPIAQEMKDILKAQEAKASLDGDQFSISDQGDYYVEAPAEEAPMAYEPPDLEIGDYVTWTPKLRNSGIRTGRVFQVREDAIRIKFSDGKIGTTARIPIRAFEALKLAKSTSAGSDLAVDSRSHTPPQGVSVKDARRAVPGVGGGFVPVDAESLPCTSDGGRVPTAIWDTTSAVFEFEDGERYEIPPPDPKYWKVFKETQTLPQWPGVYTDFSNKVGETVRLTCSGPKDYAAIRVGHIEGRMSLHDMAPILRGKSARLVSFTHYQARYLIFAPPPERYGE
jgi:hypothetical protein